MSSPFDSSIPVLTEVLRDTPSAAAEIGSHAAPVHGTAPASASSHSADPAIAQDAVLGSLDAAGWEQLERRLAERILQQLQSRVDFVLEQRIKDSMAEVLNHALHGLTQEIRSGLQGTLNQVVSRAVAQELTHLQARKK
ncbi:hypothetical protein [Massilia sp. BJB1822]|uniref:hypothetical protein n=1 Tax=Massilia sp. BJB1822 TaxID=2744470 RepID=UPI001593F3EC|nr:hypothetical protein [Massilia sp. BJB1822]NVD98183.1 hypothetical protein [Massilia sp. BJB1822]